MSEQFLTAENTLETRFPDAITPDTRKSYQGYIVQAGNLVEVATALRDEFGYDYLSSVTGVDYQPEGRLEAVYHLYQSTGGSALVLKAQTPRDNPLIPSLVRVFPGADLQEREAWDLIGIRFGNHPDLRRVLTWEGFHGHPLQKDWSEPYHEEDGKPFKTRWPDGQAYRIEDKNPFKANVDYPAGFDPEGWVPEGDSALYTSLAKFEYPDAGAGMKTDQVIVNLGPQHPSTHGVFRMVVTLDGETILSLKPVMGYLHRNHEKIG